MGHGIVAGYGVDVERIGDTFQVSGPNAGSLQGHCVVIGVPTPGFKVARKDFTIHLGSLVQSKTSHAQLEKQLKEVATPSRKI